jgi:hypothetical protein
LRSWKFSVGSRKNRRISNFNAVVRGCKKAPPDPLDSVNLVREARTKVLEVGRISREEPRWARILMTIKFSLPPFIVHPVSSASVDPILASPGLCTKCLKLAKWAVGEIDEETALRRLLNLRGLGRLPHH